MPDYNLDYNDGSDDDIFCDTCDGNGGVVNAADGIFHACPNCAGTGFQPAGQNHESWGSAPQYTEHDQMAREHDPGELIV